MQEGIAFAEYLVPDTVELDATGHAAGLVLRRVNSNGASDTVTLAARTILIAAGTQPNTVLSHEDPIHVKLDGKYFQAFDQERGPGLARASF